MEVSELDAAIADRLGVDGARGVVITDVRPNSRAQRAGLTSGMVISKVNRSNIESLEDFEAALAESESGEDLLLLVRSRSGSRFVIVK